MARLSLDPDTASAVEEALDYYLAASGDNFGSGFGGEDPDDARTLREERAMVVDFRDRVTAARERMARERAEALA